MITRAGTRSDRVGPALAGFFLMVAIGGVTACGSGEPSDDPAVEVEAPADDVSDAESDDVALTRFLPDEMRRATRPASFPHDAHVQIDCAVCHEVVAGHSSHGSVTCADCHRASALSTVTSLSPSECQGCHHAAEQPLGCDACHETPGSVATVQTLLLDVWSAARTREIVFDHDLHSEMTCARCHADGPDLTPASCASCHGEHHTAAASCASCHLPAPEGAHDVDVHLTCGGVGCHTETAVEAIAGERAVCLACHQDQQEHEPGKECIECHKVRGEPSGSHRARHLPAERAWRLLSAVRR